MRLLLDTHALLWWLDDADRLGPLARRAIAAGANLVVVSAASAWEIAIKRASGKLTGAEELSSAVEAEGFVPLAINFHHAVEAGELPRHHADPFDRMLVAQARIERLGHRHCRSPHLPLRGGDPRRMNDEDDHELAGAAGRRGRSDVAGAAGRGVRVGSAPVAGDGRGRHAVPSPPGARARSRPARTTPSCPRKAGTPRNRLSANRVWIIDPLDGTNEFGEQGRPDWAVHVALVVDGRPAAAAVALPALGRTLRTEPAPVVPPANGRGPRVVTSRHRSPQAALIAASVLGADVIRLGSAGAKAMAVVMGHADVYAHHGGMYEWDSAAPAAVAAAAGLHVSRIDGSPLSYNNADPWMPDLLVCRPELAEPVLDALWS